MTSATINNYTVGTKVRCKGEFFDSDDDPQDPGSISFKLRKPGTATTIEYVYGTDVELVRDSQGVYHVDVLTDMPGRWHYRFAGTVSGQAADEHEFHVEPSRFD
jgi:hypothetical protein